MTGVGHNEGVEHSGEARHGGWGEALAPDSR